MRRHACYISLTLVLTVFPALGQPPSDPSTKVAPTSSSTEMQRIFQEDQSARQKPASSKLEGMNIYQQDAARRDAVHKLLDDGALHSAQDFEYASFIFQHSDNADDYLLAHTLAMVAVAKGSDSALWIVAATLDRYLNKIGQPQIYGTQFHKTPDTPMTQEPYDRVLISDALRQQLGVPKQAAQQKQLEQFTAPSK